VFPDAYPIHPPTNKATPSEAPTIGCLKLLNFSSEKNFETVKENSGVCFWLVLVIDAALLAWVLRSWLFDASLHPMTTHAPASLAQSLW
jgi:hypothetical protein